LRFNLAEIVNLKNVDEVHKFQPFLRFWTTFRCSYCGSHLVIIEDVSTLLEILAGSTDTSVRSALRSSTKVSTLLEILGSTSGY